jgi:hypothetical protein
MLLVCFACSRTFVVGIATCSTPVPGSTLGAGIIGKTPKFALPGALATLAATLGSVAALHGSVPARYSGEFSPLGYVSLVLLLLLAAAFVSLFVAALLESWSRKKIPAI